MPSVRTTRACARRMSNSCTSLWLDITTDPKYAGAHHYHIVALALEELRRELSTEQRTELLQKLQDEMRRSEPN